ncbi:MAG: hypothetical protein LBS25_04875, partial [Candidatus Symbiothrix sp.]|nr:hypothetical protein [Candidatus Symbiothrix sp.]
MKRIILFFLLFYSKFLIASTPLGNVTADALVLSDGWQMRESAVCGNDGERFSGNDTRACVATKDWYTSSVPATALGVLVDHGVYPNPYIGMNVMQIPDASNEFNEKYGLAKYTHLPDGENPWAKPYWFRNEFQLPASYSGKTVWMNLDGINYRADVWLNGKKLAGKDKIAGMFHRFRLDISEYVKVDEQNVLAICIYPLDHPGNPVHAQIDGL